MLMMLMFINNLILMFMVIIGVAYVTLLERKILGYIQFRYGPNKVSLMGIVQPFGDALKLLSKGVFKLMFSYGFQYIFMSWGMFILMLMVWCFMPQDSYMNVYKNSGLMMLCLLSLGVYPIMVGGWFSGSMYSMMGGVRSIAQMISYEISFMLIIMSFMVMVGGFSISEYVGSYALMFMVPMILILFISILMELNRTPSDLIEGESELVSGFNTEYGGLNFSLIFLGEYGMIMFNMGFFMVLCFGVKPFSVVGIAIIMLLIYLVIIMRGVLPRIRYDVLMYFCWTSVLSISLSYYILMVGSSMV